MLSWVHLWMTLGSGDSMCKGKWCSSVRMHSNVFSWFTDIDECKTGQAKCKQQSYCRNEIGSYYCSCVPNVPLFNWVAGILKMDHAECYGKNLQYSPPRRRKGGGRLWELHRQARAREWRCVLAIVPQLIIVIFSEHHCLINLCPFSGLPKWHL